MFAKTVGSDLQAKESAQQLKKVKEDYSEYKTEVKKLESTLTQLKQDLRENKVGVDKQDVEDIQEILDDTKDDERYYLAALAAATDNSIRMKSIG